MSRHGRTGWTTGLAVAVFMIGTLAVGVTYATQQGGQGGGGRMRQGMMHEGGAMAMVRMNLAQLGLSDEQKQQVKTIFGNHQGDFQALRQRALARPARACRCGGGRRRGDDQAEERGPGGRSDRHGPARRESPGGDLQDPDAGTTAEGTGSDEAAPEPDGPAARRTRARQ